MFAMRKEDEKKVCMVCEEAPSKYRCPSCSLKYCSVACFKSHKEDICERETNRRKEDEEEERRFNSAQTSKEELDEGQISGEDNSDDEDRLNTQDLDKLEHSEVVKGMLRNRHLRQIITNIDSNSNPEELLKHSMQEPIFAEFVDQCFAVVQPNEQFGSGQIDI